MAVAGLVASIALWYGASKFIESLGGDPEGEVAGQIAEFQGLAALQQQGPVHKLRQRLEAQETRQQGFTEELEDFSIQAREIAGGRQIRGGGDLLDAISRRLNTTPEALGRQLSPERSGDYSSVSKAAFGRSAKQMDEQ